MFAYTFLCVILLAQLVLAVDPYLINGHGTSPGVQCNAWDFFTKNHGKAEYKNIIEKGDDYYIGTFYYRFGSRPNNSKREVIKTSCCSRPEKSSDGKLLKQDMFAKIKGKRKKYLRAVFQERDEFPFNTLDIVKDASKTGGLPQKDVAIKCIPDIDNNRDGAKWKAYLSKNKAGDKSPIKIKVNKPDAKTCSDTSHFDTLQTGTNQGRCTKERKEKGRAALKNEATADEWKDMESKYDNGEEVKDGDSKSDPATNAQSCGSKRKADDVADGIKKLKIGVDGAGVMIPGGISSV